MNGGDFETKNRPEYVGWEEPLKIIFVQIWLRMVWSNWDKAGKIVMWQYVASISGILECG